MIIESSAPTRVDLEGGTIDIWPIYLFHAGASTVNFGISLRAHCQIETRSDEKVIIESRDRGVAFETEVSRIEELATEPRHELVSKLVHFFRPKTGFHLTTNCTAPAGAGLGGSSALAIATIGALNEMAGHRYDERKFIMLVSNIETQVIRVPAGFQDYYGAFYGGVSSISYRAEGIMREPVDTDVDELERRVAICYTGEPRNSGINNWEVFKRHIDGDRKIFDLFERIRDLALRIRRALGERDWDAAGEAMREAYPLRRSLAPNITTPHMDALVEKALANGAIAAKVCGAGGGGCIAFFCEEGRRADVERALGEEEGAEILDWRIARDGLVVRTS